MVRSIAKSLAIVALLSSSAAYADTPGWQVSEIRGNVTVARNGIIKVAQRQTKLAPGDVIKTGPKGRAVLLRGGEYLVVSPSSHIEIAQPAKSGKVTQIIEYLGNVLFRIDKKETPHFGVKTPYMAAVVKGTTFSVSVSADGTAVQVTEGAVELSTLDGGASELVTPGVIGMINANDPFSLVIMDGERRVIESPNKLPTTSSESAKTNSTGSKVSAVTVEASSDLSGVVSVPISEEGIELAQLTNGLIRGDISSNRFMLVENAEESVGAVEDVDGNFGEEEQVANDTDDGPVDQGDDGQSDDDQSEDDQSDDDQSEDDQSDDDQSDDDQSDDDQSDDDQSDDDRDDDDRDDDDRDDDDDGNNGHGNDADGQDDSNPGRANGNGNGRGNGKDKGPKND